MKFFFWERRDLLFVRVAWVRMKVWKEEAVKPGLARRMGFDSERSMWRRRVERVVWKKVWRAWLCVCFVRNYWGFFGGARVCVGMYVMSGRGQGGFFSSMTHLSFPPIRTSNSRALPQSTPLLANKILYVHT